MRFDYLHIKNENRQISVNARSVSELLNCFHRNRYWSCLWFTYHRLCSKSNIEATVILICNSWFCIVRSNGAILYYDSLFDPVCILISGDLYFNLICAIIVLNKIFFLLRKFTENCKF